MNNKYAVKFLGKIVKIEIDRPINSRHLKYNFVYEKNYGFVPRTKAPDGEEIDAYLLGIDKPIDKFTGKCVAVVRRLEDNDDKLIITPEDYKWLSDDEILREIIFQEKWFNHEIIRPK